MLLALHKSDGSLAWKANLPAWGTTAPLVWQDPTGTERILVGDTAGFISAWTAPPAQSPAGTGSNLNLSAAPPGQEAPVFLVEPDTLAPIPCHEADGAAQNQAALRATASHRVRLSDHPHPGIPGQEWMPLAGAAVELSLDGDLLLAGVNETADPTETGDGALGTGKLMAFRPVQNLQLEAAWAENGHMALTVTNHGTGTVSPQVAYGWSHDRDTLQFWRPAPLAPGASARATLALPAPAPPAAGTEAPIPQAVAVLSPYLYAYAQAQQPAALPPLPAAWQPALAPPAPQGSPDHPLYHEPPEAYLQDNLQRLDPAAPVAAFSVESPVSTCQAAIFTDQSYHPLGLPIVERRWTNRPTDDRFPTPGRIPVSLWVQDALGRASELATQLVTVEPCPDASGSGDPGDGPPPDGGTSGEAPGHGDPPPGNSGPGQLPVQEREGDPEVSITVAADPSSPAPRGVKVNLTIQVDTPDRYVVDEVRVYLPPAFRDISYCLGTGQCFTVENTHTLAGGGQNGTYHYDFVLAWTQTQPPDGLYGIQVVAQGRHWWEETYTETHPNLVEMPDGTVVKVPPPIEHVHTETKEGTWTASATLEFRVQGHVHPYVQMDRSP